METTYGIYVGLNPSNKDWKFIPNTPEALEQAVAEGCRAKSLMSFEYEYSADKPEPNRKGNLFIDFDNYLEPFKAIVYARKFCGLLHTEFNVDLRNLRYWLSGSKGCHIEIPSEIYGDTEGDSHLPKIHKTMVHMLAAKYNIGSVDSFIYKMKRGQLIRMENIQRDDGRYKVPITLDEFMNINTNDIQHLTLNKREINVNNENNILRSEKLICIFESVKNMYRLVEDDCTAIEALLGCNFIFYCLAYDGILAEKQQELICSIFFKLGDKGIFLFNNLFKSKISDSSNNIKAVNCSCANIRKIYPCDKDCSVKGPYDLVKEYRKHAYDITRNYRDGYDGFLYYLIDPDNNRSVKLCSSLKVLGKMRDERNLGWSRCVEIETPDGTVNRVKISMKDLITSQNNAIGELVDNGLEICSQSPKALQLIKEYISYGGSNDKIILDPRITGWIGSPLSTYALPDELITEKESVYKILSGNIDHRYKTSGTLEDWINNVGKLCIGNDILILVTSYAFTGPLLRIANAEGGGLHIYGGSSTGKTSIAAVAGSICGSDGQKGYMHQWRLTHNALESIATQHNDNFLVLDEISQASSETVNDVTYMLTNGQGKFRLKSDATPKQAYKWMLNYLYFPNFFLLHNFFHRGVIYFLFFQLSLQKKFRLKCCYIVFFI
jgi:hypothetical protein